MSRSRLHGPPEDQRVEVHADDAHHALAGRLGTSPGTPAGSMAGQTRLLADALGDARARGLQVVAGAPRSWSGPGRSGSWPTPSS